MIFTPEHDSLTGKIALGTVQFGVDYGISNEAGKTDPVEVGKILDFCREQGILTLDTAFSYGNSETVLGGFDLNAFQIVSKFITGIEGVPSPAEQLRISLERLKLEKLHAYLAHRPFQVDQERWRDLQLLKQRGLVDKIGFSFSDPVEIQHVLDLHFIPDMVQAPFNYLDRRFAGLLQMLQEKYGTEVHTRSVFLQGLFFMDPASLPEFFHPIKGALDRLGGIPNKAGALLRHALSTTFIDKVVVGVNNLSQLKDNLAQLRQAGLLSQQPLGDFPSECLTPSHWPPSTIR